jgi:hypothetical protein
MGLLLLALLGSGAWLIHRTIGPQGRERIARAMRPAVKWGGIAFALGFVGPMILDPGANQGPMLGIFITGPLGFMAGLAYGIARG